MQECKVCLMDGTVPSLVLNKKNQCQYCEIYYKLSDEYPLNSLTAQKLNNIVKKIKISGRGKKYDCVCGISGGRDSSYTLYYIKEVLGLRPLAVHYDNGFNSQISTNNLGVVQQSTAIFIRRKTVGSRPLKYMMVDSTAC